MKRVCAYARVSSDDRGAHGDNLTSQLQICHEYAEGKGYRVVAELREDIRGVSGADVDAPELNRAVEMARAGEFDVLVVREMDRLARDINKQFLIEQELRAADVIVEYALYDFPDNPSGRLNKTIYAALAQFERDQIRLRTMRGRRNSAARGNVFVGPCAPFGYRVHHENGARTLQIDEDEANVVRLIFQWYISGDGTGPPLSGHAITKKLSAMGIETAVDRGRAPAEKKLPRGRWAPGVVRKILANETYAGTRTYNIGGERITTEVPAVISRQTFQKAKRRRATGRVLSPRNLRHKYLLRGMSLCGACGERMHVFTIPKRGKQYPYYRCRGARRRIETVQACDARTFRADAVDPVVWEQIKSVLSSDDALEQIIDEYRQHQRREVAPLEMQLALVDSEIDKLTLRLERLFDAYELDGEYTFKTLRQRQQRIERNLAEQNAARDDVLDQMLFTPDAEESAETLAELAASVRADLDEFDNSFDDQRWLLEVLEVQVILFHAERKRYAQASLFGMKLPQIEVPRLPR